jgi:hypothetical protein
MILHRFLTALMVVLFTSSQVLAQQSAFGLAQDSNKNDVTEYFYSRKGTEVLRPIKLLGKVNKPGIYQVPQNTSLTTLLAIAGGSANEADLSQITIANTTGNTKFDFETSINTGKDYNLNSGDIVFVPEKKYFMDSHTGMAITVMTGIVSVLLTGYLVSKAK